MAERRYTALRIVAILLSLCGILVLLFTLILVLAAPGIVDRVSTAFSGLLETAVKEAKEKGEFEEAAEIEGIKRKLQEEGEKRSAVTGARFGILVYGLIMALGFFASGELLRLMIAVEEETRVLAEIFEKKRV
ncbi:MAG: hypothetical protein N2234_02865 [Planctomycetota bacterium]|nr:hypothetical protein [Planctomycetota bacterium]